MTRMASERFLEIESLLSWAGAKKDATAELPDDSVPKIVLCPCKLKQ